MKTGDCRDPMTREHYSDEDLIRLDNDVKKYFPENKIKDLLERKANNNL
jgi:hypothetical protein